MKITNNNPSSPIEFLYDGFIFMLKIKNRKIINWPDCAGSVGQLLRIYNREENLLLEKKINEDLLKDPIPQETIDTILKVLPSREYLISKQSFSEYYVVSNIVSTEQELFATGYYPFHDDIFMFTQPKSTINPERVEYYKTLIKSGARPKVVTFHIDFPNEYGVYDETPYFIIDGHHKALAYESLKMNIEVLNFESESFFKDRMDDKNRLLLLDLIDVLDLDSIIHIMKNNPRIYHDDSENGKKYNRYFDSMLGQSKQFYGTLLQYLEKEYKRNTQQSRTWVMNRLDAMLMSLEKNKTIWVNYKEGNEKKGCNVSTFQEFDEWIEKVIGVRYSKLKK